MLDFQTTNPKDKTLHIEYKEGHGKLSDLTFCQLITSTIFVL